MRELKKDLCTIHWALHNFWNIQCQSELFHWAFYKFDELSFCSHSSVKSPSFWWHVLLSALTFSLLLYKSFKKRPFKADLLQAAWAQCSFLQRWTRTGADCCDNISANSPDSFKRFSLTFWNFSWDLWCACFFVWTRDCNFWFRSRAFPQNSRHFLLCRKWQRRAMSNGMFCRRSRHSPFSKIQNYFKSPSKVLWHVEILSVVELQTRFPQSKFTFFKTVSMMKPAWSMSTSWSSPGACFTKLRSSLSSFLEPIFLSALISLACIVI